MREEQPHGILKRRERSASPLLAELLDNPVTHRSSLHLDLGPESPLSALPTEKDVKCELQGKWL